MSKQASVVVTGAASGIGRAIAARAGSAGYHVVIADIDEAGARAVADQVVSAGGSASHVRVDMGEVSEVVAMVDRVVEERDGIDALVNNAAITRGIGFFDVAADDWDRFSAVNARGSFFAMQHAARAMVSAGSGGAIVNIASIAGKGWAGTSNVAYASTKGAVIAMTRVAAAQLGPYGIRVNAVCPGVTETSLMTGVLAAREAVGGPSVDLQREELAALAALRRITQPDDVAGVVLHLLSPESAGMTGQSINVDSGILWD